MKDVNKNKIGAADGGFPERASVAVGGAATVALEPQVTVPQKSKAESVAAAWKDLFCRAGRDFSAAVAPFGAFCIEHDIAPLDVSSESAARFTMHWLDTHDRKSSTQAARRFSDVWNANAGRVGVSTVAPPLPRADRGSYCADLANASPAMRSQIEDLQTTWMTQPRRGRVLKVDEANRRLRILMLYAGAVCEAMNRSVASYNQLEDLVAPEPASAAYRYVLDRARKKDPGLTKTTYSYEMARVVAKVAEEIYPHDDPRRIELHRMKRDMAPAAKTRLSPRKQKAVSPFIDPEFAREARDLPHCYYQRHVAKAYRDRLLATELAAACGAELLMATSMWPCEAARLRLGDLTETVSPTERVYTIRTRRGDMPKSYALGSRSSEILHAHLTRVRPYRPGAASDALFPGKKGATQNPAALARRIAGFMSHHLDHQMPASDLPDAIAVMLGMVSAENEGLVRQFMGRVTDQPDPLINSIRTWRSSREADDDSNDDDDAE